jgi:hydrogenase expression/formation protein HypC
MCLAIPIRVKSIKGDTAVGEVSGVERDVSLMMTPEAKVGDYVIVHAGFAIQILDQHEARENLKLLRQMAEAAEGQRRRVRSGRVRNPDTQVRDSDR